MEINADLHIHSKYSAATSAQMRLDVLARETQRKGIQLAGTGDCLHPKWLAEIKDLKEENGVFSLEKAKFILTTEVEDSRRVHHLLIIPGAAKAEELREKFSRFSSDINTQGRPRVGLSGEEIAEYAKDADALIGPCHAFTPWTALYAYHDSLKSCYGDRTDYISFVELGLSADSSYADRIAELRELTFLTNSDAHSPMLNKFAREFNRLSVQDVSFDEVKKAVLRTGGRKFVLNVGMPPEEGKYNESACIKCYTHYSLEECKERKWICSDCGARIKKGVKDRVSELASYERPRHPEHRPEYQHLIPLSEIIALALGNSSPSVVKEAYDTIVSKFQNEVQVLVDAELGELDADERIVEAIRAFREHRIRVIPGGGGSYGKIELAGSMAVGNAQRRGRKQKTLSEFN